MCGLFAARNKQSLIELSKSNLYRGSRTHSVSTFRNGHVSICRFTGAFDPTKVADGADFYICHVQAPTNKSAHSHPAIVNTDSGDSHIWHNGILLDRYLKSKGTHEWDTMHIAEAFPEQRLSELEGSFACFHFMNGSLSVFRNDISPLFMNEEGTAYSSTRTIATNISVPSNKVFNIDLRTFKITQIDEFTTMENPYFFI